MISIKVPPLGESIVEATVSRWLKKKGEAVASGDTIVELETDKITVEVPAPRAGVISSLSVAEGDVVKVDQLLGEIDETAAARTAVERGAQLPRAPAAPPPAPPQPASAPRSRGSASSVLTARRHAKSSPAARRAAADAGIAYRRCHRNRSRRCCQQARCHRACCKRDSHCRTRSAPSASCASTPVTPPRHRFLTRGKHARRCRRAGSASPKIFFSHSTPPLISRRSTKST